MNSKNLEESSSQNEWNIDHPHKLYIFDMDGTLINSEQQADKVCTAILQSLGYDPSIFSYSQHVGQDLCYWRKQLLEVYGSDFPLNEFASVFHDELEKMPFLPTPGAKELLLFLKEKGARLCIATANSGMATRKILTELGFLHLFDAIFTKNDVQQLKPHPEVYELAIQHFQENPKNCYAIEDSFVGSLAAQRANIPSLLVPWYSMDPVQREKLHVHKEFRSLHEVLHWIQTTEGVL